MDNEFPSYTEGYSEDSDKSLSVSTFAYEKQTVLVLQLGILSYYKYHEPTIHYSVLVIQENGNIIN